MRRMVADVNDVREASLEIYLHAGNVSEVMCFFKKLPASSAWRGCSEEIKTLDLKSFAIWGFNVV